MPKMDAETLTKNLQHFCGTEQYYPHWLGIRYTDGLKYLAGEHPTLAISINTQTIVWLS